jgi:hypothetical protein
MRYNIYSYGFCYADNRYDSLIIRVKLNLKLTEDIETYDQLLPHPMNREDRLCSEEIRLKFDDLNKVLLGYLRTIFKEYYVREVKKTSSLPILLTKPKDLDYELFVFRKYLGLMQYLL